MKKTLLTIIVLMLAIFVVKAQTLSDGQIMEFIIAEQANGSSQQDIAKKLMSKGVSLERLMNLKSKYEAQETQPGALNLLDYSSLKKSRLRNNNSKKNVSDKKSSNELFK